MRRTDLYPAAAEAFSQDAVCPPFEAMVDCVVSLFNARGFYAVKARHPFGAPVYLRQIDKQLSSTDGRLLLETAKAADAAYTAALAAGYDGDPRPVHECAVEYVLDAVASLGFTPTRYHHPFGAPVYLHQIDDTIRP